MEIIGVSNHFDKLIHLYFSFFPIFYLYLVLDRPPARRRLAMSPEDEFCL